MTDDLISRKAVLEIIGDPHPLDYNAVSIVNKIRELQSVKAHYYLNYREEWYDMPRECTICGCRWMTERDHQDHYCPNCGAEVSIYDGGKCLSD